VREEAALARAAQEEAIHKKDDGEELVRRATEDNASQNELEEPEQQLAIQVTVRHIPAALTQSDPDWVLAERVLGPEWVNQPAVMKLCDAFDEAMDEENLIMLKGIILRNPTVMNSSQELERAWDDAVARQTNG